MGFGKTTTNCTTTQRTAGVSAEASLLDTNLINCASKLPGKVRALKKERKTPMGCLAKGWRPQNGSKELKLSNVNFIVENEPRRQPWQVTTWSSKTTFSQNKANKRDCPLVPASSGNSECSGGQGQLSNQASKITRIDLSVSHSKHR